MTKDKNLIIVKDNIGLEGKYKEGTAYIPLCDRAKNERRVLVERKVYVREIKAEV